MTEDNVVSNYTGIFVQIELSKIMSDRFKWSVVNSELEKLLLQLIGFSNWILM